MLHICIRLKYLSFLFFCCLLWQGCNVINPAEPIPTYIHIDSFHFVGNRLLANVPTMSHITNVSVFYNNNPVGNFDLPATVPIIATGTGRLQIAPGINVDGMNNLTGIDPFYQQDTSFAFTAQPGKILNFTPKTSFYNAVKPHLISSFVAPNFGLFAGNIGMTILKGTDTSLLAGIPAGCIQLYAVGDSSVDSFQYFPIPTGTAAYIEFDYKCSVPFYVGIRSNLGTVVSSTPFFLAGIFPSGYWQHFYLDVTDYVGQYPGDTYNFFIKAATDEGETSGRVLIDNIYLITF
jgi:hypothetical protein